jgi:hypothetical protein
VGQHGPGGAQARKDRAGWASTGQGGARAGKDRAEKDRAKGSSMGALCSSH